MEGKHLHMFKRKESVTELEIYLDIPMNDAAFWIGMEKP